MGAFKSPFPITKALDKAGISYQGGRGSFNIPCPLCDAGATRRTDFHMNINTTKDVFCCPKCGTQGGAIAAWGFFVNHLDPGAMTPEDRKQVMREVKEDSGEVSIKAYQMQRAELPRKDLAVTDLDERDFTYSHLLQKCTSLTPEHYNSLIKRGLRAEDIKRNGYASVPIIGANQIPSELRMQYGANLAGVPGFYKPYSDWLLYCPNDMETGKTATGFYIPVRAIPEDAYKNPTGKIQGLQWRADSPNAKPRYKWVSTKDFKDGAAAETWAHFVGYPQKEIWLTEGPLKGDIAHRFSGDTFICVPGVNALLHFEEDAKKLLELGVRHINIAFDMDYKTNPHVQKALKKLIDMIERLGFTYTIREWDERYKGIDDYYLAMYLQKGGKLDPFI